MVLTLSTRAQNITNFIQLHSYLDGVELSPGGSLPEEQALQWLINNDPLRLTVGNDNGDEFRLLQRYSVLNLWFQSDTGTSWIDSTNWLNDDECSWTGIRCVLGVVTIILLPELGLQGTLSRDLGLLSDLTLLDLHSNNISGSLPTEIGLWANLTYFDVSNNRLSTTLPSEIGSWANLTFFIAHHNLLTGTIPETIVNWSLIQQAWFEFNEFNGSMPNGICEFISGKDLLQADCDLACRCCTWCV